jgi:alpha-mannosidase
MSGNRLKPCPFANDIHTMRLKHPELTLCRVSQFFTRLCCKLLAEKRPVELEIAGPTDRISREAALKLDYRPASLGDDLGPDWSTHWLKVRAGIPAAWQGKTVLLRFHTGSEALLWLDGAPYHGFNTEDAPIFGDSGRAEAVLPAQVVDSGRLEAEVEIACNGLWGVSNGAGTPACSHYKLHEVQLALRDEEAWRLAHDLVVPLKWLEEFPETKCSEPWMGLPTVTPTSKKLPPWPGRLLQLLNHFCNICDSEDRGTWAAGRDVLREIYAHHNATFAHQITAVGHAHIDTAWLWPIAETKRKCSRSFSTALNIMERHPTFRFACSQAQQYAWMRELYPALYERIRAAARRGQWLPVGGTWVEPDCNIPSGESLVRQFLLGQRFFKREFGAYCREFWNPDVFGYSGALPQIMQGAGIEFFLTQKLSWNQFNKPHHQNFYWEGIDGSRVLTHFPPADTYNALDAGNLIRHFHQHERNAMDHDRVNEGLMLFGWGDGGGGPNHHMMEVIERIEDFQGFPRVQTGRPDEFFDRLKAALDEAPVMVGELYFEYHRGTYTTQAANKRDNRLCERMLRDVELLAAIARHEGGAEAYPGDAINSIWEKVLLNQFHDILPGSSIRAVYEDSDRDYTECLKSLGSLKSAAAPAVVSGRKPAGHTLVNTLGWERTGLVELPDKSLALATAPSCGCAPLVSQTPEHGTASAVQQGGQWILENGLLRATFDAAGRITSLRDLKANREVIAPGSAGNRFVLFEDYPHLFDAWDVDPTHLEKSWDVPAESVRIVESGALRASLEWTCHFGESRMTCRALLAADAPMLEFACEVDWRHRHRFLKVEFPVAVHAPEASFEIQFGHVRRATHFNTSHDVARFESPAHFWADLSEEGYGVALLNDCKYGHAVHGNVLRLSLLRGSTSPDPKADIGRQCFRYALYPHAGTLAEAQVVRRAQEFNTPWTIVPGAVMSARSWFNVDSPHLIIDTVKKAEDSDALIVRLYECHGARGSATLATTLPFARAERVDLLEEQPEPIANASNGAVPLSFHPFEIITVKLASA